MKPAIRRTMRVATTFTGAAACVVAVNPAAIAATAQPAARAGHQQLLRIAIGENRRLSGSIRSGCGTAANTSHWLHIRTHTFGSSCYGFRGALSMSPYPNMRSFCGGTNFGAIWGSGNSGWSSYPFYSGNYFKKLPQNIEWFYVSRIAITGWHTANNYKCP
jgi:hypothetical protein